MLRAPSQNYAEQYDAWFERNPWAYNAELRAVKSLISRTGRLSLEIGVGTGRFAAPLSIKIGIDPSRNMGVLARKRGIQVIEGMAEELPFGHSVFDLVLIFTTLCFVDDIQKALKESFRVLSEGGHILIGMIDRNSPNGQNYITKRKDSVF